MRRSIALACFLGLFLTPLAHAHYPYFVVVPKGGKAGTLRLYFEGGPAPGDGQYLDPFLAGKFWLRTPGAKPRQFKMEDVKESNKRWAAHPLDTPKPRAIDCYAKWGVYKGRLLHYYAKHIDVTTGKELAALNRAENLVFDLVPRLREDGMMEVKVLFEGKPKSGLTVNVGGPARANPKSDENGIIRFKPAGKGLYTVKTQFIDPKPTGKDGGKEYKGLRQTVVMTINLPVE